MAGTAAQIEDAPACSLAHDDAESLEVFTLRMDRARQVIAGVCAELSGTDLLLFHKLSLAGPIVNPF